MSSESDFDLKANEAGYVYGENETRDKPPSMISLFYSSKNISKTFKAMINQHSVISSKKKEFAEPSPDEPNKPSNFS